MPQPQPADDDVRLRHLSAPKLAEVEDLLRAARPIARAAHHKLAATVQLQLTDDLHEYRCLVDELNPRFRQAYPKAYSDSYLAGLNGQVSYGYRAGVPAAVILVQPDCEAPLVTVLHEVAHAFCGRKMGHNYSWRRLHFKLVAALLLAPACQDRTRLAHDAAAWATSLVHRYTARQRGEGSADYTSRVRREVEDLMGRLNLGKA